MSLAEFRVEAGRQIDTRERSCCSRSRSPPSWSTPCSSSTCSAAYSMRKGAGGRDRRVHQVERVRDWGGRAARGRARGDGPLRDGHEDRRRRRRRAPPQPAAVPASRRAPASPRSRCGCTASAPTRSAHFVRFETPAEAATVGRRWGLARQGRAEEYEYLGQLYGQVKDAITLARRAARRRVAARRARRAARGGGLGAQPQGARRSTPAAGGGGGDPGGDRRGRGRGEVDVANSHWQRFPGD